MDATLRDANSTAFLDVGNPGTNLDISCPDIRGFNSFASVSDAEATLAGRWVGCIVGDARAYGEPETNLVSLGAPADAVGVEFAAATAGGGSCGAVEAGAMPCAGGPLYYLVEGSTGLVRGQGSAYESSYAVLNNGLPGLEFVIGGTPTFDLGYGPPGRPASASVLSVEATNYAFVSLVAVSSLDAGSTVWLDAN